MDETVAVEDTEETTTEMVVVVETVEDATEVQTDEMEEVVVEEETAVMNAKVGILKWLDAGIGYAFETEKVLWNVRVQPIVEQKEGWRPGIILGTGSVQIGQSDQSLYAQLIKSFEISEEFDLRLSAGTATLLPDFDEFYGLAGITASFHERFAVFTNYDGKSYHEGVSWIPLDILTLSFLMVESESPAISVVIKL